MSLGTSKDNSQSPNGAIALSQSLYIASRSLKASGCRSERDRKQQQSFVHQNSGLLKAFSRENAEERNQTSGLSLGGKRTRSQSPQETEVPTCEKRQKTGTGTKTNSTNNDIAVNNVTALHVYIQAADSYSNDKGGSVMGLSISSTTPEEEVKRPSLIVKLNVSLQKALKQRQVCRIRLAAALPSAFEVSSRKLKDLEVVVESIKGIRILETQNDSGDNQSLLGQWMKLVSIYLLYCKDTKDPPAFDEPFRTLRTHVTVCSEIRKWWIEHHKYATEKWSSCVADELVRMADWGSEISPRYAEVIINRFVQFTNTFLEAAS